MPELGNAIIEIQTFTMTGIGNEFTVTVPDNTTVIKFAVTISIINRYYLTGDTTDVFTMAVGHYEAIQDPKWAGKDFYLEGVSGGICEIEFHKGLLG